MGRRRCLLPIIKAEEIEGMVWDEIVNVLTYGGIETNGVRQKSKLEELIGGRD